MRRCADLADCGNDNRDSDAFCSACGLPLINTVLAGRYVVEALIRKGGFAALFQGVDQNQSRRIVIKVLLQIKATPTEQEHFLREARITATLDHPNITRILDYGKDGPSVFLVMPLYTTTTLRTRLALVNGPLPATETIQYFHQLVNALHYLHTRPRPVIHRNIKPENILIHQEDYRLVITNFGMARSLEPGTRVGKTITVRGTGLYMAPEQAIGIVDPRSDQFSCAMVLYEMLTGYYPFDEHGGGPIIPPATFNRELPSALDAVVLRALAARPEDRFVDMLEFLYSFGQANLLYKTRITSDKKLQSPRPLRVFLCHSFGDKPTVRGLYKRLQDEGIAPWLDEEDLLPGQNWQEEIRNEVRNCDIVIICLSKNSINKVGYVQKEIKFALDVADEQPEGTIFLIPLRLEECKIPDRLTQFHWVNYFDERGFDKLIKALEFRANSLFNPNW